MVYCSNCGEKNRDTSTFCANCGEPLRGKSSKPPKPLKSKSKSYKNNYREDKFEKQIKEKKSAIEWNVVVAGALIFVIITVILGMIIDTVLPGVSLLIAGFLAFIYILAATKRASTLIVGLPLTVIMAACLWAFFSL
jgi:hypothetical protein